MISKSLAHDVLEAALANGGDFAEIFVENKETSAVVMLNGFVEEALWGVDYGCGIRIFNGLGAVYAYTNDTSASNLLRVAKEAAEAVVNTRNEKADIKLAFENMKFENIHPIITLPQSGAKKIIVEKLKLASDSAFAFDPLVTQTSCQFSGYTQDVLIANSEGMWAEDRRVRTRAFLSAVASEASEKQTGSASSGAHKGFEFFENLNTADMGNESARMAVTMLKGGMCPSGKMPVIVGNAFGGVIFHEACGHSLEATSVAPKDSVFSDCLGKTIASGIVTAIDDGAMANEWGSLNIDDEGTKTQRNMLIKNGVLKSYLIDKLNGIKMGMPSTGSSRRESYKYAPTSRMTNTFIAPGTDKLEDIIADTEYGLYAKSMSGGSVDTATGEFNFAVREAYLIESGKIGEAVRGATLIGKGSEVLQNIDRVSTDLELAPGMCGSLSGAVPTTVGQPTIRVREITVGGRK
ncbi:MAG: TldD/PmbA family protein [Clostridiales bacterium]|jgi:TldD protein|nr:TldD/PmbA family protein [Clostridiales bacterium]